MARTTGETAGVIIMILAIIYIIACMVVHQQTGAWSWTPWNHIAGMIGK